jgi:hypothetical protein
MAEKKKFLLRIDDQLYSALEKWAANEFRSINAQIEFLLSEALRKSNRLNNVADNIPEEEKENKQG